MDPPYGSALWIRPSIDLHTVVDGILDSVPEDIRILHIYYTFSYNYVIIIYLYFVFLLQVSIDSQYVHDVKL